MTAHIIDRTRVPMLKMQLSDASQVKSVYHTADSMFTIESLYVGIVCYDGDVRLVNGSQPYKGRVEVCVNEVWGKICADMRWDWSSIEANVVCKQLGYPGACKNAIIFFLWV